MDEVKEYLSSEEHKDNELVYEIQKILELGTKTWKKWNCNASDVGPCDFCKGLDGKEIRFAEKFEHKGYKLNGPPAHKGCRCSITKRKEVGV